jgi:predicted permease
MLLAEAALLAVAGGAVGLVIARLTLVALGRLLPLGGLGDVIPTAPDPWTVGVTAALALGTGVIFGLYPAVHATRPDLAAAVRAGAGQIAGGARTAARFRATLVAAQIALATALLVSAGLFARSLANVSRERLGVNTAGVLTFELSPERNGYSGARSAALFAAVEDALGAAPGVSQVTTARVGLLRGDEYGQNVTVEGFRAGPETNTDANVNWVGPGFFAAMGTPLLAGREFTAADRAGAPRVVVVNEAFVRKFGLGRTAVGRRMAKGGGNAVVPDREIVGVVRDAKYSHVRGEVPPLFFVPARQDTTVGSMVFYARTTRDVESLRREVPGIVRRLDANLPVEQLKTLPAQVREDTLADRLLGALAGAFAALATLLAAVGLYGVLAYTVAQRTRELGVRMALGATGAAIRRLVLGQMGRLVVAGGVVGLVAALAFGRLAQSLLYGLSGADPLSAVAAVTLLAVVAVVAAAIPAARAARVDPTRALRQE